MNTSEAVQQLRSKLGDVIIEEIDFKGQKTLTVRKENLREVLVFLKQTPKPGYEILMDYTAVDYVHPVKRTEVIYWLHNPTNLQRLRVNLFISREESIPSIRNLWEGADWYERELYDMFGVKFEDFPTISRILMPDDWVGHPLRRDYPLTEEPVQFKHGVKPKVPSRIIPYVKNKNK